MFPCFLPTSTGEHHQPVNTTSSSEHCAPSPSPIILWFPCPLRSRPRCRFHLCIRPRLCYCLCFRPRSRLRHYLTYILSFSAPVSASAPSPLPSLLASCVRCPTSIDVPVSAPSPFPLSFLFPSPNPFLFLSLTLFHSRSLCSRSF